LAAGRSRKFPPFMSDVVPLRSFSRPSALGVIGIELIYNLGCRFPNVGFISVIRVLADIFDLPGFIVWHTIMVILICITWVVLFFLTLMAFWRGKIFFADPEDVLKDTPTSKQQDDEERTLDGHSR